MKQALAVILCVTLLSFTANQEKQILTVKYTVEDWQNKINMIEYTKNVLKNSNAAANIVLPLVDSLGKFQNELVAQLQVQIKADTTKKR